MLLQVWTRYNFIYMIITHKHTHRSKSISCFLYPDHQQICILSPLHVPLLVMSLCPRTLCGSRMAGYPQRWTRGKQSDTTLRPGIGKALPEVRGRQTSLLLLEGKPWVWVSTRLMSCRTTSAREALTTERAKQREIEIGWAGKSE